MVLGTAQVVHPSKGLSRAEQGARTDKTLLTPAASKEADAIRGLRC